MHLNQQDVNEDQHRCSRWQYGNVKTKKAGERGAGYIISAAQEPEHWFAHDWNHSGDLCPHFRRKESELVPRQQISAEAKTDHDEQEQNSADPG